MEQLKIELREPTPEDYRRASLTKKKKTEDSGEVKATFLGEDEIQKLYKLAGDISGKDDQKDFFGKDDQKDFFKREKSLGPPRNGVVVKTPFPPPENQEKPEVLKKEEEEIRKELRILRYTPEGEDFEDIGQCLISFNQPMVPLCGIDELEKYPAPVKMTPHVEGEWRWVGTKTVKWKPSHHRLPKSTNFEVTVEKGAKSEWGCSLKETLSYKFSTIPVRTTRMTPMSRLVVGQEPPILLEFNQRIDPDEILKRVKVSNTNGKVIPLSLGELKKLIEPIFIGL